MVTMTEPFIRCVDYWPEGIPENKLKAYKALIEEGQITKPQVIVNRQTHATSVEYLAIMPHEWVREELKKRTEKGERNGQSTSTRSAS